MKPSDATIRLMSVGVCCGVLFVACGDDEAKRRGVATGGAGGTAEVGGSDGSLGGAAGTGAVAGGGMGGVGATGGGGAGAGGEAASAGTDGGGAAGVDGAVDSGGDVEGGSVDAADDAPMSNADGALDGPTGPISRMTVILPGGTVHVLAVDASGSPLVFQAGAAFDHDGVFGQDIFVAAGSTRYRFDIGKLAFVEPATFDDAFGAPLVPDLLLSGDLLGSPEQFFGVFGSDARLYSFPAQQFSDAIPLLAAQSDGGTAPFSPRSAATVDLTGTGSGLTAIEKGSHALHVFDAKTGRFVAVIDNPTSCTTPGPAIDANLVFSASFGLAAETVVLVAGSDAWLLDLTGSFPCFNGPVPLVDSANDPIFPDFAFGWDFDGNGTDDVVLFDRVTR